MSLRVVIYYTMALKTQNPPFGDAKSEPRSELKRDVVEDVFLHIRFSKNIICWAEAVLWGGMVQIPPGHCACTPICVQN